MRFYRLFNKKNAITKAKTNNIINNYILFRLNTNYKQKKELLFMSNPCEILLFLK